MVTFRAVGFPQGRPTEATPVGDPYDAATVVDAGRVTAEQIGRPEPALSYRLEYMDREDLWQAAGSVWFGSQP